MASSQEDQLKKQHPTLVWYGLLVVSNGWKSDNGFWSGYLKKLEEALKKEYPITDLMVSPNITSKLTIMKKNYGSIVTAHRVIGVGVNMTTMQLDCTDEQWEEVTKNDPTMRGTCYKEWTYYSDWVDIFSKDYAKGESAEDVTDVANLFPSKEPVPIISPESDYNDNNYDDTEDKTNVNNQKSQMNDDQKENNTTYTKRSSQTSKGAGKKRKSNQVAHDPVLVTILNDFCRNTDERLVAIANWIGYDHDLGIARKKLYEEPGKIQRLSIGDKIHVAQ